MTSISITIKNEKKVIEAFHRFPSLMASKLQMTISQAGVFVAGKVKEHITAGTDMWKPPIDTGQMRQGIHADSSGLRSVIRPSSVTPYATGVHEGTHRMRPRPFFEITARHEQQAVEKFVNNALEKAVREAFG